MNLDAKIGRESNDANKKTPEECARLLGGIPGLERRSPRRWVYGQAECLMTIDALRADPGGSAKGDEEAWIDTLDTRICGDKPHTPEALWTYTQLRLALAAAFGWRVLDYGNGERHLAADASRSGALPALRTSAHKAAVPVQPIGRMAGSSAAAYRWKSSPTAKSEPRSGYTQLAALDDDRLLHAYSGGSLASSIPGIQVRRGRELELECTEEIEGVGRRIALREDGRMLLAQGELVQGHAAHIVRCGSEPLRVIDRTALPLSPPFAWVPGTERLIAAVPRINTSTRDYEMGAASAVVHGERLLISEQSAAGHPWLRAALDPRLHHLVEADPDSRTWKPLLLQSQFAEHFDAYEGARIEQLQVSLDGRLLYTACGQTIGCFDRERGEFLWTAKAGGGVHLYALSLSPCGRYLAAGGLADDREAPQSFSLLHADSGRYVYRLPVGGMFVSAVYEIAWHPSGYLALGLANGTLIELGLDAQARHFRGLKGGIRSICYHGDWMYVTGAEKNVRLWYAES
ncbi:hypothetical protein QWJ34_24855 [Saccharibacillus sp. CPCC 101409]|uniref:WD40 repeat domain-containing protein n=1 Tax=Saccharibacillus sp. CPCC 101409 TaxID=3058041 RepID=UPI002670D492|nr:hypothetical protein [Saccharibacillus sp. CPCC 101409]MDO3413017.1 hypothetical protein [Saccharibacillus sp. CPCC 101409]